MAFFDKINDFAKTATEKTNTVIETTKLTAKADSEQRNLDAIIRKIGEHFVAKMDSGEVLDEEAMAIYQGVLEKRSIIAEIRTEIEVLKAPKPEPAAPVPGETSAAPSVKFCPHCGTQLNAEAKFCTSCGKEQ